MLLVDVCFCFVCLVSDEWCCWHETEITVCKGEVGRFVDKLCHVLSLPIERVRLDYAIVACAVSAPFCFASDRDDTSYMQTLSVNNVPDK